MAQRKGQTGNPYGRPKGSPNKMTMTLREFITTLIDQNRDRIQADLDQMEPSERFRALERLMQYVIPRLSSVESKIEEEPTPTISVERLAELLKL